MLDKRRNNNKNINHPASPAGLTLCMHDIKKEDSEQEDQISPDMVKDILKDAPAIAHQLDNDDEYPILHSPGFPNSNQSQQQQQEYQVRGTKDPMISVDSARLNIISKRSNESTNLRKNSSHEQDKNLEQLDSHQMSLMHTPMDGMFSNNASHKDGIQLGQQDINQRQQKPYLMKREGDYNDARYATKRNSQVSSQPLKPQNQKQSVKDSSLGSTQRRSSQHNGISIEVDGRNVFGPSRDPAAQQVRRSTKRDMLQLRQSELAQIKNFVLQKRPLQGVSPSKQAENAQLQLFQALQSGIRGDKRNDYANFGPQTHTEMPVALAKKFIQFKKYQQENQKKQPRKRDMATGTRFEENSDLQQDLENYAFVNDKANLNDLQFEGILEVHTGGMSLNQNPLTKDNSHASHPDAIMGQKYKSLQQTPISLPINASNDQRSSGVVHRRFAGSSPLKNKSINRQSGTSIQSTSKITLEGPKSASRIDKHNDAKELGMEDGILMYVGAGSAVEGDAGPSSHSKESRSPKKVVFISNLNKKTMADKVQELENKDRQSKQASQGNSSGRQQKNIDEIIAYAAGPSTPSRFIDQHQTSKSKSDAVEQVKLQPNLNHKYPVEGMSIFDLQGQENTQKHKIQKAMRQSSQQKQGYFKRYGSNAGDRRHSKDYSTNCKMTDQTEMTPTQELRDHNVPPFSLDYKKKNNDQSIESERINPDELNIQESGTSADLNLNFGQSARQTATNRHAKIIRAQVHKKQKPATKDESERANMEIQMKIRIDGQQLPSFREVQDAPNLDVNLFDLTARKLMELSKAQRKREENRSKFQSVDYFISEKYKTSKLRERKNEHKVKEMEGKTAKNCGKKDSSQQPRTFRESQSSARSSNLGPMRQDSSQPPPGAKDNLINNAEQISIQIGPDQSTLGPSTGRARQNVITTTNVGLGSPKYNKRMYQNRASSAMQMFDQYLLRGACYIQEQLKNAKQRDDQCRKELTNALTAMIEKSSNSQFKSYALIRNSMERESLEETPKGADWFRQGAEGEEGEKESEPEMLYLTQEQQEQLFKSTIGQNSFGKTRGPSEPSQNQDYSDGKNQKHGNHRQALASQPTQPLKEPDSGINVQEFVHQNVIIPNPSKGIKDPHLEEAPTELVRSREEINGELIQFETFEVVQRNADALGGTLRRSDIIPNTEMNQNPSQDSYVPKLNMTKLNQPVDQQVIQLKRGPLERRNIDQDYKGSQICSNSQRDQSVNTNTAYQYRNKRNSQACNRRTANLEAENTLGKQDATGGNAKLLKVQKGGFTTSQVAVHGQNRDLADLSPPIKVQNQIKTQNPSIMSYNGSQRSRFSTQNDWRDSGQNNEEQCCHKSTYISHQERYMKEILKDFGCQNFRESPMMRRIDGKRAQPALDFRESSIRANSSLGLQASDSVKSSKDWDGNQQAASFQSANLNGVRVMQDFIELKSCLQDKERKKRGPIVSRLQRATNVRTQQFRDRQESLAQSFVSFKKEWNLPNQTIAPMQYVQERIRKGEGEILDTTKLGMLRSKLNPNEIKVTPQVANRRTQIQDNKAKVQEQGYKDYLNQIQKEERIVSDDHGSLRNTETTQSPQLSPRTQTQVTHDANSAYGARKGSFHRALMSTLRNLGKDKQQAQRQKYNQTQVFRPSDYIYTQEQEIFQKPTQSGDGTTQTHYSQSFPSSLSKRAKGPQQQKKGSRNQARLLYGVRSTGPATLRVRTVESGKKRKANNRFAEATGGTTSPQTALTPFGQSKNTNDIKLPKVRLFGENESQTTVKKTVDTNVRTKTKSFKLSLENKASGQQAEKSNFLYKHYMGGK